MPETRLRLRRGPGWGVCALVVVLAAPQLAGCKGRGSEPGPSAGGSSPVPAADPDRCIVETAAEAPPTAAPADFCPPAPLPDIVFGKGKVTFAKAGVPPVEARARGHALRMAREQPTELLDAEYLPAPRYALHRHGRHHRGHSRAGTDDERQLALRALPRRVRAGGQRRMVTRPRREGRRSRSDHALRTRAGIRCPAPVVETPGWQGASPRNTRSIARRRNAAMGGWSGDWSGQVIPERVLNGAP